MADLTNTFTSTGAKFFAHQEAMQKLRNGEGRPITTHVMLTDRCNHTCAFCSVQHRSGDSLCYNDVVAYLDILVPLGLKSVILSGGGNPIMYKCKTTGKNVNDVIDAAYERGLEIGLITNGMMMKEFSGYHRWHSGRDTSLPGALATDGPNDSIRRSWKSLQPYELDRLTWIRVSMAGLDHDENEVYVPDVDPSKTTLGFSYVAHDIYDEPLDAKHGKVSTQADLLSTDRTDCKPTRFFEDRIPELTRQFARYCATYHPRYLRLLPNCLEPSLIPKRCEQLQQIADDVNRVLGMDVVFVQNKPPRSPNVCLLGYIHPVLNTDGYIYPCDSCVLNDAAGHKFANPWRVCHWSEIASVYEKPVRSLIDDPKVRCPGCVFPKSNEILELVWRGDVDLTPPVETPEHVHFV